MSLIFHEFACTRVDGLDKTDEKDSGLFAREEGGESRE